MGKKLLVLALTTVMICGVSGLSGCSRVSIVYANYTGDYGDYEPPQLVMNAGETLTITATHFQGLDIEFDKFEFTDHTRPGGGTPLTFNALAVSLSGNVITARHNGFVNIYAYLYEKEVVGQVKYAWTVLVAQIQVINIAEMTEITTAQEFQDMTPDGNYILRANIDLDGFDWKVVNGATGSNSNYLRSFRGSLINPDGYVIKNLTSTVGIFGMTWGAYIDGITLENVDIDSTGVFFEAGIEIPTDGGGIAAYSIDTIISNCKVEGTIKARNRAGGIVGFSDYGVIKNCEFNGVVIAQYQERTTYWASAGGIAGEAFIYSDRTRSATLYLKVGVFDCKVNAEIDAIDFAGGIVGYNYGTSMPENCIFTGTTQGAMGHGDIFGYSRI